MVLPPGFQALHAIAVTRDQVIGLQVTSTADAAALKAEIEKARSCLRGRLEGPGVRLAWAGWPGDAPGRRGEAARRPEGQGEPLPPL